MDIVFGVERQIEVEHRWHVLDVQPTGGHVGTHQQIDRTALEGFQGLQALVLRFVAVQGGGFQALALQRAGQAGTAQLAVDKDEGLLDAALAQHMVDGAALVLIGHTDETLLHRGSRGIGAGHLDGDRVLQVAAGQSLDFGREGGREQQRGALLGQVAEDALQVRQKADVEHAVGLVQHHIFHLVEHAVFGLDVIQQAAWRGHQHFHTFFQLGGLGLHVHAAKHHCAAQLGVFGIQRHLLGHLVGQLAGGQQHQGTHRMAGGRGGGVFVLHHALQQRQREGSGFAGARLGCTHHIAPLQNHRNGLGLDGGHGFVAHFGHGACQRRGQR